MVAPRLVWRTNPVLALCMVSAYAAGGSVSYTLTLDDPERADVVVDLNPEAANGLAARFGITPPDPQPGTTTTSEQL